MTNQISVVHDDSVFMVVEASLQVSTTVTTTPFSVSSVIQTPGPPGLSLITADTETDLSGILKGNGEKVSVAISGIDYAAPLGADDNYISDAEKSYLHAPHSDDQDLSGYSSNSHTHTPLYQPLSSVLNGTTASFTTEDESKLNGIESGAEVNIPETDPIFLASEASNFEVGDKDKLDGLSQYTDEMAISAVDISGKVDKITGKGLSTEDYSTSDKNKLSGIAVGAEVNVQSDWNAVSGDAFISNKPIIPDELSDLSEDSSNRRVSDTEKLIWNNKSNLELGETSSTAYAGDKGKVAYDHSQSAHAPSNAEQNVNADWTSISGDSEILNKPTLGTASTKDVPVTGDASDTEVVLGADSRMDDARTPTVHASSHGDGQGDEIIVSTAQVTNLDTALTYLKYGLATGILEGGAISKNITDPTEIDITTGKSLYVDFSDTDNPVIEVLTWFGTTIPSTLSSINNRLWVGVHRTGLGTCEFVFSDEFTPLERRTIAILGRCWSEASAPTEIEGVGQYSTPAFNGYKALTDLLDVLGSLNKDGNVFTPNGTNLLLNKTSGHSFRFSANFLNSPTSPHIHNDTTIVGLTAYHYHIYNGAATVLETDIDPEYYDVAGTKTAVTAGKFTVQRIYYFPKSQVVDIVYGQALYDTLALGIAGAMSEQVQIDDANLATLNGSILRGYIIVQQGCTDLSDVAKCSILKAANLGAGSSSGGTSGVTAHSALTELDYASAGHTGFLPATTTQDNIGDGTTYKQYSDTEKTKLSGIATGAEVNVQSDWNASSGDAYINNKPNLTILEYGSATGIIEGGELSINVVDNTLLDVDTGKSLYVDFTNASVPIVEVLEWNAQTVDPQLTGVLSRVWVGVHRLSAGVGELVFSEEFTPLERRTIAILGRCWSNASAPTVIEGFGQYSTPAFNGYKAFTDFIDVIGSVNKDGNVFVPNGANLLLNKSDGHSFRFSANFLNSPTSPHMHNDTVMTGIAEYHYHWYAHGTTVLETDIDPEYYDVAGTKTAVPTGKFTVQRVYYFPKSQVIDIVYGQALYDTLVDAESYSDVEAVQIDSSNLNTLKGAILRAYICVQQGCTTLNNATQCSVLGVSNFGAGAAGGGTILSVAGSDGQIQYNKDGILAATINMSWNEASSCLNIGQSTILPDNPLAVTADAASYAQVNFRNTNTTGSIDLVFTADDGTDSIKYGDLGFCNSAYTSTPWDLFVPYDIYLFSERGDCYLGSLESSKSVKVFISTTDGEAHPSDVVATINNSGINIPTGSQYMINGSPVGGGTQNVFIQDTEPTGTGLWIQTNIGGNPDDFSFWLKD